MVSTRDATMLTGGHFHLQKIMKHTAVMRCKTAFKPRQKLLASLLARRLNLSASKKPLNSMGAGSSVDITMVSELLSGFRMAVLKTFSLPTLKHTPSSLRLVRSCALLTSDATRSSNYNSTAAVPATAAAAASE